ncbi:serine/threonine protein kinase [Oculatella sp. LEGE 06141]|uniref:serine/threonine protein kinase n=1 Tax=Oculatella sp. LEGE 06141 TaxID=1828648 RepID=UPI001881EB60|nr:serine/threonine-protein kinase [Oculatella sp. LEGE 06141]MBE9182846.1 serine/threonine protein kinase [Oculatella sp. LEGE 06141]
MSQHNFSWSAGQILHDRYQFQQQLGHNGDRQVWLSTDLKAQPPQSVVVKLLPFYAQMQWDEFKLFERETVVLKSLNHPRVPRYQDSFTIDATPGISWFALVETFIPGRSLAQSLQQGTYLTALQIRNIAIQVLTILIGLHERNPPLLHRDIKPSNLIVGSDRQVYLIDFGSVQSQPTSGATMTVVGTSGYAPPEQFFGRAVPESDLYALGATLIHLLTGTAPADLPQKELQIQFREQVSVPDALAEWIEKLTAPDVDDRFHTAREALATLKAIDLNLTARSLPKPADSRIQLHKTAQSLQIIMPEIGLSNQQIAAFLLKFGLLVGVYWLIWEWWSPDRMSLPVATPQDITSFVQFIRILAMIPWGMTLYTLIKRLKQQWQPNWIVFQKDRSQFRLNWRLLGWCWQRQVGGMKQMQEVNISVQVLKQRTWCGRRSHPNMVLIQAGDRRHTFGVGSTEAECNWLVHEIKHWLRPDR